MKNRLVLHVFCLFLHDFDMTCRIACFARFCMILLHFGTILLYFASFLKNGQIQAACHGKCFRATRLLALVGAYSPSLRLMPPPLLCRQYGFNTALEGIMSYVRTGEAVGRSALLPAFFITRLHEPASWLWCRRCRCRRCRWWRRQRRRQLGRRRQWRRQLGRRRQWRQQLDAPGHRQRGDDVAWPDLAEGSPFNKVWLADVVFGALSSRFDQRPSIGVFLVCLHFSPSTLGSAGGVRSQGGQWSNWPRWQHTNSGGHWHWAAWRKRAKSLALFI